MMEGWGSHKQLRCPQMCDGYFLQSSKVMEKLTTYLILLSFCLLVRRVKGILPFLGEERRVFLKHLKPRMSPLD